MKAKADLVQGWLLKAESDLTNARMCIASGQALDTACFHAQQAAERCIKAFLTAHDVEFPFIHNLEKLIELCAAVDESFSTLKPLAQDLTPYAVGLRYDNEFWPDGETAQQALDSALTIHAFVTDRLPSEAEPTTTEEGDEEPNASETHPS